MASQDMLFREILEPTDLPAAILAAGERARQRQAPASHKGGAPGEIYLPISPVKAAKVGPDAPAADAPQGEGASKLGRNMAKLRAEGLAIGAASGMQGLAEARGSGDEDYAPLGPVLYSALGRKAALEMVDVTADMKAAKAYQTMRLERMNARMVGKREKRRLDAEAAAKEKN